MPIYAMKNKIRGMIEQYESIILFRHVFPDMDALGSQFGLAYWIQDQYPDKKVFCAGTSSRLAQDLGLSLDVIPDDQYADSLGIVLDASTAARVDDQRYKDCCVTIRIDHHVQTEHFCDWEWIDEKASATCEMLSLLLQEQPCTQRAAQLLYNGLIADNVRFTTTSVRPKTFEAAGYLVEHGADVVLTDQINFSSSLEDFQYETCIRQKAAVSAKSITAIMEIEDYAPLVKTFALAKEKVYALSGISSMEIWALFTRMEDGVHYSASLRSRTIPIRDIAQAYHGGGHACASGIKNLTTEQVHQIIQKLAERSLQETKSVQV